jgi:hypothetical protein
VDDRITRFTISVGGRPRDVERAGSTASDLVLVSN